MVRSTYSLRKAAADIAALLQSTVITAYAETSAEITTITTQLDQIQSTITKASFGPKVDSGVLKLPSSACLQQYLLWTAAQCDKFFQMMSTFSLLPLLLNLNSKKQSEPVGQTRAQLATAPLPMVGLAQVCSWSEGGEYHLPIFAVYFRS